MMPGLFITFEGLDGCGKSTCLRDASEWLKSEGYGVVATREPGGVPVSEYVRDLLLTHPAGEGMTPLCEALLFAAARAQHVDSVIAPALERGEIVLCDRFVDSSVAYQGYGRGLGPDLVWSINQIAIRGWLPDLTLLFDVDVSTAAGRMSGRGQPDRIEKEPDAFACKVREGYCELAARYGGRIKQVDAGRSIEGALEQTRARIRELLANRHTACGG
jgi:dTMP kinase